MAIFHAKMLKSGDFQSQIAYAIFLVWLFGAFLAIFKPKNGKMSL